MKKIERAEIILKELKKLYPSPPIPLDHTNAFTLLVAVVLSAQSTDKKVNELTKELFKVADNPEKPCQYFFFLEKVFLCYLKFLFYLMLFFLWKGIQILLSISKE